MAHEAAGGQFAGVPHYTKVKGPDGKEYAVAGDVPIRIEKGKTPQETIRNMQQVIAAALAPANPSPQDLKVAQMAESIITQAEQKLHQKHQHIDIYA
jgi:predicted RNase H-like HicB family nuclease